jgi:hypothetical protein
MSNKYVSKRLTKIKMWRPKNYVFIWEPIQIWETWSDMQQLSLQYYLVFIIFEENKRNIFFMFIHLERFISDDQSSE